MPTYQYACTACGERLEAVQSFTDAALTDCPACGGALRKVFSAVGVVFKGSGFYRNDSRATSTSSEAGSTSGSASGSTSESAKESSPAASAKPAESSSPAPAPATSSTSSGSTAS